jgi:hypothetical protein
MKALATLITALLLTLASASAAEAHTPSGYTVTVGVASVQLTRGEVKALRAKEVQIMRFKQRALRDGRLSKMERQKLRSMRRNLEQQYRIYTSNRVRRL